MIAEKGGIMVILLVVLIVAVVSCYIGLQMQAEEVSERWQNFRNLFSVSTTREAWHLAFFLAGFAVLSIVFVLPETAGWMIRAQQSDDPAALFGPLLMWGGCLIIFLLFVGATLYATFLAYIYVSRARSGYYDEQEEDNEDNEEENENNDHNEEEN